MSLWFAFASVDSRKPDANSWFKKWSGVSAMKSKSRRRSSSCSIPLSWWYVIWNLFAIWKSISIGMFMSSSSNFAANSKHPFATNSWEVCTISPQRENALSRSLIAKWMVEGDYLSLLPSSNNLWTNLDLCPLITKSDSGWYLWNPLLLSCRI